MGDYTDLGFSSEKEMKIYHDVINFLFKYEKYLEKEEKLYDYEIAKILTKSECIEFIRDNKLGILLSNFYVMPETFRNSIIKNMNEICFKGVMEELNTKKIGHV